MNKHIAKKIALAQRASDCGKWHKLSEEDAERSDVLGELLAEADDRRACNLGYRLKDEAIADAIRGIRHNPDCGFKFRVTHDDEKRAKFIVYFDYKLNGRRMQVSFHSFNNWLGQFVKGSPSGHWDRSKAREACIALLKSFGES